MRAGKPAPQAAGGIPMHAPADDTAPPRSGPGRLMPPWEYRHLRAVADARFAAGGFTLGVGLVLLSLGRSAESDQERRTCYGWGASFLGIAALSFSGGFLDTGVARSAPPRA
jgi:hypothetical protein